MSGLTPVSPGSQLTFSNDWTSWLPQGQTIVGYAWTISPDEGNMLQNANGPVVTVSGTLRGKDYVLMQQVTTDGNPPVIGKRGFLLRCEANL